MQFKFLKSSAITAEHLGRKAIVYVRQSSRENAGTAAQRNQVDLARAYGWPEHLIEVIDEDLGKSGSSVEHRNGWRKMLEEIAANTVGAVFVANISRLGREMLPIEELRILAGFHGTILWLDNRFSDPNDPNDTILTQITASFLRYENRKRAVHMSEARMAKARLGLAMSSLPVGWTKTADGKFDYDPAVKKTIRAIIDNFMKVRSIQGTVKVLAKVGIKVPSRQGRKVKFVRPSPNNVKRILVNPAYAGTYVFGKTESRYDGPVSATGQSARLKVPEHRWVKIPNHHPAYMTEDQQQEIKLILSRSKSVTDSGVLSQSGIVDSERINDAGDRSMRTRRKKHQ